MAIAHFAVIMKIIEFFQRILLDVWQWMVIIRMQTKFAKNVLIIVWYARLKLFVLPGGKATFLLLHKSAVQLNVLFVTLWSNQRENVWAALMTVKLVTVGDPA